MARGCRETAPTAHCRPWLPIADETHRTGESPGRVRRVPGTGARALPAPADAVDPWAGAPCKPGAQGFVRSGVARAGSAGSARSAEHTSELQSLMRILSAVFFLI